MLPGTRATHAMASESQSTSFPAEFQLRVRERVTQIDFDHIRWPLCGTQLEAAPWNWHGNEFAFLLLARFELYVCRTHPLIFRHSAHTIALSLLLYFLFIFRLFSLTHTHSPGVYARVNFNSLAQSCAGVQIGNPAVFAWRARERKG